MWRCGNGGRIGNGFANKFANNSREGLCVCVCVCGLLSAWDEVGVSMVTLDVGSVRGTTIQDGEWRVVIVSGTGMGVNWVGIVG